MSTNPYVDSRQLIDTKSGKPFELIHERAFVNISIATGWKPSDDGLFSYYKDILLPVKEDEAPVTLSYSPFVMVPQNSNSSCRPSNFPYARTVENNTVRLYAYRIPDPNLILPITITMKEVNTSEGSTNGSGVNDNKEFLPQSTFIQIKGTSFIVPTGPNNYTTEAVEVVMEISAFRGDEKRDVTIGNLETIDVMFNMDGSVINTKDNNIEISANNHLDEGTTIFRAKIPKGVLLKDKLAYFIVPVSSDGLTKFARATLRTTRTDETINSINRYEIFAPQISVSTGGIFYANGIVVGENGIEFKVDSFTVNGVKAPANGNIKFYNDDTDVELLDTFISGSINIFPNSILIDVNNLLVEFYDVENKLQDSLVVGIATDKQDIEIHSNREYLMPKFRNDKYIVDDVNINFFLRTTKEYLEPFFGIAKVSDENGTIFETTESVKEIKIPQKEYDSGSLPSYYKVSVTKPGETAAAATLFISIFRSGDTTVPIFLDVSPGAIVIPATSDGTILSPSSYGFKARVLKGVNDVSSDWEFKAEPIKNTLVLKNKEIGGVTVKNEFELVSMNDTSGVANITATLGNDVLTQQVTFSRIRENDSNGNYTFIRYANKVDNEDGSWHYELTPPLEEGGEPGLEVGEYYGIATTEVDEAPLDVDKYRWFPVNGPEPIEGEQGDPGQTFYIDGDTLVTTVLNAEGELVIYPETNTYSLESADNSEYLSVKWQYKSFSDGAWIEFSESENQEDEISINHKLVPYGPNNSITIRAEVKAIQNKDIVTFYPQLNIYLLYAEKPNYFGQVRKLNGGDIFSHTFPVDRFLSAINGTMNSKNPIRLTIDVFKGATKLKLAGVQNNNNLVLTDIRDGENWINTGKELLNNLGPSKVGIKYRLDGKIKNLSENELFFSNGISEIITILPYEEVDLKTIKFEGNGDDFKFHIYSEADNPAFIVDKNYGIYEDGLSENMDNYFIVKSVAGEGVIMESFAEDEQLISYFKAINGSHGKVYVTVILPDETEMYLPFSWNTEQNQNNLISSISTILSREDFIIEEATLGDIKGWSNIVANRPDMKNSLMQNNNPIEVRFNVNNTNIESISLSRGDLNSFINIDPQLLYNNDIKGLMSPISMIDKQETVEGSNYYYGNLVPNELYLIVSKGFTSIPKLQIFGTDSSLLDEIILPDNYNFGTSKAMVIKPIPGSERFIYSDDSLTIPYFFKFSPLESVYDLLMNNDYYDFSMLNVEKLPSTDPVKNRYGDILPIDRVVNENLPYSYQIDKDGIGFMRIDPGITLLDSYFNNNFANSNTNIRVDTTTGESTTFSIYRRVYPYRELGDLTKEIENVFKGVYFDSGSINTIKMTSIRIEEESNRIIELIDNKDIEIERKEMAPIEAPYSMLYPPVLKDDKNYYPMNTIGDVDLIEGVNFKSISSMLLYDEDYYYIEFSLKASKATNINFFIKNASSDEVIGEVTNQAISTTPRTYKYIIPAAGVYTLSEEIKDYIVKEGIKLFPNKASIKIGFEDRTKNIEASQQFSPYTLNIDPINGEEGKTLELFDFKFLTLRPTVIKTENIYKELHDTLMYTSLKLNSKAFIDEVEEIVTTFNNLKLGENLLTETYADIVQKMSAAQSSIEVMLIEMDAINRRDSAEGIFRSETTNREHIFGYTDSKDYLASITITPNGSVIKGEKNQIIGSTSIGELYGKKLVIGKTITQKDIDFDKLYRENTKGNEGFIGIWSSKVGTSNSDNGVWSSSINKDGHFFMRYNENEDELIGYMVMNSKEIAAYQFNTSISEGISEPAPIDVHNISSNQKSAIFSISEIGHVNINRLNVRDTGNRVAQIQLMDTIQILRYTTPSKDRDGIVFVGV